MSGIVDSKHRKFFYVEGIKMKREWSVTDCMGNVHHITYKAGGFGGARYTIDNDTYKAKSRNWFIFIADYQSACPERNADL